MTSRSCLLSAPQNSSACLPRPACAHSVLCKRTVSRCKIAKASANDDMSREHEDILKRGKAIVEASVRFEKLFALEDIEVGGDPQSAGSLETAISSGTLQLAFNWPSVDWSRYNVQILFVDRSDTLRGRVATGIFERIAEWNGYGRALYPWSCGLQAGDAAQELQLSRQITIMNGASCLGLLPRHFARVVDKFELEDLDRYDLVVTMDTSIREEILQHVSPIDREYYSEKVCLLTSFSCYESDNTVLAVGGLALLPLQLSFLLRPGLDASKQVVDISSPELAAQDGAEQWMAMVRTMILASAGLVKYLIDAYPENQPHYDPQD